MARGWRNLRTAALTAMAIMGTTQLGSGQVVKSAAGAIGILPAAAESLTLSLSANSVKFTLLSGKASNAGNTSVTATTTWTFNTSRSVTLYAYFTSSTTALTDGAGHNIPSSAFQISDNGGGFLSLVNTEPFGGANAGVSLGTTHALGNGRRASRSDLMNFNINLSTGMLPQLPAASYTGTLTLRVQAQ